jgi:cellulose synthase/poly-beta-1,6-N-acetylglucosamine synthase-like glycosyltransferase
LESCLASVRGTLLLVMLRLLATIPQILIASLVGYNAVVSVWGWKNRRPAGSSAARNVRVAIPAHNEAPVVGGIVSDLMNQTHPADATDIVVIADRCTDGTSGAAAPARVIERSSGVEGKGAALAWYLEREPIDDDEILVVIDADNRVPDSLLERISDEISAGHDVVQVYLDSTNPDQSAMAMAYAMSYWAGNRMVQLARSNLGWSADLGGTGMAFTGEALSAVGGFGDGLAEDQDLGVRLALAGKTVYWVHDVRIHDEKPTDASSAIRQRARWMAGKRQVARMHVGALWRGAIEHRSGRLFDVGLRLVQPGRSFVALLSGALTVAGFVTRSRLLLPWPIWGALTAVQLLEPIPFLARDGVPLKHLIRYPFLVILAVLWIPIRVASSVARGWGHTQHSGAATGPAPGGPVPDRGSDPT